MFYRNVLWYFLLLLLNIVFIYLFVNVYDPSIAAKICFAFLFMRKWVGYVGSHISIA